MESNSSPHKLEVRQHLPLPLPRCARDKALLTLLSSSPLNPTAKVVRQLDDSRTKWGKLITLGRGHGDAIQVYRHQEDIVYIRHSPSSKRLAVAETASRRPWGLNIANTLLRIFDSSNEDATKWTLMTVYDLGPSGFSICWLDDETLLVGTEVSAVFSLSLKYIKAFPLYELGKTNEHPEFITAKRGD